MRYWLLASLILLAAQCSGTKNQEHTAEIASLLAQPSSHDNEEVSLSGKVSQLDVKTSRAGNEYETFSICETEKSCIKVFRFGSGDVNEGDDATVKGHFHAINRVGAYTFYNEIIEDGSEPSTDSGANN